MIPYLCIAAYLIVGFLVIRFLALSLETPKDYVEVRGNDIFFLLFFWLVWPVCLLIGGLAILGEKIEERWAGHVWLTWRRK